MKAYEPLVYTNLPPNFTQTAVSPMHEIEVDVVGLKISQGRCDSLRDALVPWVVQLCGDPNLRTRYTRIFDTLADLLLVAISKSANNMWSA